MASADSGNMLLLLSAVDQSLDRSNSNKLGESCGFVECFTRTGFLISDEHADCILTLVTIEHTHQTRIQGLHSAALNVCISVLQVFCTNPWQLLSAGEGQDLVLSYTFSIPPISLL